MYCNNKTALWLVRLFVLSFGWIGHASAADFEGTLDRGFDRPGKDYHSFSNATISNCQRSCRDAGQCVAYSFVPSSSSSSLGTCFLKEKLSNRIANANVISGAKIEAYSPVRAEPDTNRPGNDYRNFAITHRSPEPGICATACRNEIQCQSFTYVPPGIQGEHAQCWLKNGKPTAGADVRMDSGVKPSLVQLRQLTSVERGYDRPGYDYWSSEVMGSNALYTCRQFCGSFSSCRAYTFKPQTETQGTCYLKSYEGTANASSCPNCTSGTKQSNITPTDPPSNSGFYDAQLDGVGFRNDLSARLQGFSGYSLVVRNDQGDVIVQMSNGYAKYPVSGGDIESFSPRTPSRIGSISKTITAAAVLNARNQYPDILTRTMGQEIPASWPLHADYENKTFEQVLKHRARIRNGGGTLFDVLALPQLSSSEVDSQGVSYSNYGIESFNLLLPGVTNSQPMEDYEYFYLHYSADPFLSMVYRGSDYYRTYVRNNLFAPLEIAGACRPDDIEGGAYLYSRDLKNFSYSENYDGWLNNDYHCQQGAWVLSAHDLSRLFHAIANTEEIISAQSRQLMMPANRDVGLGIWPGNYRGLDYWTHNGSMPDAPALASGYNGGIASYAEAIIFPNGYVAAFIANSEQVEGESAFRDILEAFIRNRK